ncbi:MAG TPA: spermidine/putrescine ABC transporter substrate-binding protein PotD, partial [Lentisphaeria bacterium]|nr:spermidine/putrescine ABC transporter substrate-binding protein PotD [Lentisphaeria bacterium]
FLDFIHRPDIAAANTEHVFYCCPNKDAYELLSDDVRNNPAVFIDPEIFAKSKFTLDLGENLGKYTKLWDEIKAGK